MPLLGIGTSLSRLNPAVEQSESGKTPLSLGGVTFFTQEVPEHLDIGAAEQMIAVHDLPGGTRITHAMGNRAKDVAWTGRFFDANVALRVRQLRAYQVSGQEIPISWGTERYFCIVKSFDPGYRGGYNAYAITVTITRDNNGAFALKNATSIDQQVTALQSQAEAQYSSVQAIDPSGAALVQQSITNLRAAIAAAIPLAVNLATEGNSLLGLANLAVQSAQAYVGQLSELASQFAMATALVASLQMISANIARGQSPTSTTVVGGSLFALAATAYGDIAQAFPLALANGLVSPLLSSQVATTVVVPPVLG